jgi:hypothetical protein
MKKIIKSTTVALVMALFTSCTSSNDDNSTTTKPSSTAAKPTVQAAPLPQPTLTVTNNSNVTVLLSLIAAQTQPTVDPLARMYHKGLPGGDIAAGQTVTFLSYDNATPSGYRPPTWNVSNYANTSLSGNLIPSSVVQSTYNTAYWSGLYINAKQSSGYLKNYPVGTGSGDRRFIGEAAYGNFNPTQAGNFGTPYTQIGFGPDPGTIVAKAIWSTNPATGNVTVDIAP